MSVYFGVLLYLLASFGEVCVPLSSWVPAFYLLVLSLSVLEKRQFLSA